MNFIVLRDYTWNLCFFYQLKEIILVQGIKEGAVVKNIKNKDPIKFIHSEKKNLKLDLFLNGF